MDFAEAYPRNWTTPNRATHQQASSPRRDNLSFYRESVLLLRLPANEKGHDMHCRILQACVVAGMAHGLIVAWCAHPACGAAEDEPLPPFGDVKKTVEQHFAEMPDYQPGDIVTQSEVQPLFAQLKQLGWTVADQKDILSRVPTSSDFLVRQLRTRQGARSCDRSAVARIRTIVWNGSAGCPMAGSP